MFREQSTTEPAHRRSAHSDVLFADGLEDGQEMGDAEEVADGFAHVGDFKRAAYRFGVDVESNQRAEAAAIHVCEMLEVENDSLGPG